MKWWNKWLFPRQWGYKLTTWFSVWGFLLDKTFDCLLLITRLGRDASMWPTSLGGVAYANVTLLSFRFKTLVFYRHAQPSKGRTICLILVWFGAVFDVDLLLRMFWMLCSLSCNEPQLHFVWLSSIISCLLLQVAFRKDIFNLKEIPKINKWWYRKIVTLSAFTRATLTAVTCFYCNCRAINMCC